jgi:hypothetical protein
MLTRHAADARPPAPTAQQRRIAQSMGHQGGLSYEQCSPVTSNRSPTWRP